MTKLSPFILITIPFLWIGFISAISFMEAWLKFKAPGITLPLGLGIGRIVFNALNKVEWMCLIIIMITISLGQRTLISWDNFFIALPAAILLVQSLFLLPELNARAEMYIRGWPVEPSYLHTVYIVAECVKVISLLFFGLCQFFYHS